MPLDGSRSGGPEPIGPAGSGATAAARARNIDHLAVAVNTLDEAMLLFSRLLGIEPEFVRVSDTQRVRVAIYDLGGTKLELMEGTDSESTVARFVLKKGPGLHHVCYAVDDLKTALDRLRQEGFEVLGTGDDIGIEGRQVAFLHPRSTGGVLTEFIQAESAGD
jgi:methylmalonyl-CoA epimerase